MFFHGALYAVDCSMYVDSRAVVICIKFTAVYNLSTKLTYVSYTFRKKHFTGSDSLITRPGLTWMGDRLGAGKLSRYVTSYQVNSAWPSRRA